MNFFIERKVVSFLIAIAILLYGAFAYVSTPKTLQPEITVPIGTVTTVLPGANPKDVESLVTKPLEKEIATIDSIKTLSSSSGLGTSVIIVEFEAESDLTENIQKLKDKANLANSELPEDALTPLVTKIDVEDVSAVSFSITGKRPKIELSKIAENIAEELEKVSGVGKILTVGKETKVLEILVDKDRLNQYSLDLQTLSNIVKTSHTSIPIGIINIDQSNYSLRIDNQYQSIQEILETPITVKNNSVISLKDVAKAQEKYLSPSNISKLSNKGEESLDTITLQVFKKKDSNSIEVVDSVKEKVENIKASLPADIKITVSNDNSLYIRQDLGVLTENGLQTMLIIALILFLAMGLIEGLIAALFIPLSLCFAMIIIYSAGMSINSLTLFSLVIALGLMVDNAIVIMEGIHQNMKSGLSSKEAALETIRQYKWPLTAGTLTTVFAFFPMLLVSGIVGQFMKTLPVTISAALLGSLAIPLTIGASISAKLMEKRAKKMHKKPILEPVFDKMGIFFHWLIYAILATRLRKLSVLLITLALFIGSMALPATGLLKVELFPKTDMFFFIVNIETPIGTTLEKTGKITEKIEKELYNIPEIENFLTIVGSGQSQAQTDLFVIGGGGQSNQANITVNLVDKTARQRKSYEITEQLRKKLENFSNAKITVQEISEGPPGDSAITVRIKGKNLEEIKKVAKKIEDITKNTPGTLDVNTTAKAGLNEFKFTLDRDKLSLYGLSPSQVGFIVRNSIQGVNATSITLNNEDLEVIIKYDLPTKDQVTDININEIENLKIVGPKGEITLNQIGSYKLTDSLVNIEREDQKRIIKVSSELAEGYNAPDITTKIQAEIDKANFSKEVEISFGGDTEEIDQSFQDLFRSMFLAIILILATLVTMFNSIKQTIVIMFTLPLGLIGVFPGLYLAGLNFSFPAFLGIVALAGVVVNDAIVLVDRINKNFENKLSFIESIAEAAKSRLEPIFMTTITTVAGILPLALVNEFWRGLGLSLIFGLTASTIFTLTVIPVIFAVFERKKAKNQS